MSFVINPAIIYGQVAIFEIFSLNSLLLKHFSDRVALRRSFATFTPNIKFMSRSTKTLDFRIHLMSHSIEQYLLHAALRCGLEPGAKPAYRLQLFLVANRDLGSKHHESDFQRAIETAVDVKGLFSNHEGKGSGEYALTLTGLQAANNQLGAVQAVYEPTLKESFKATMRGTVGKTEIRIVTCGQKKSRVFFGNEELRSATEACRRLEESAGISLPPHVSQNAARFLRNMAIDRGFEIEFQ